MPDQKTTISNYPDLGTWVIAMRIIVFAQMLAIMITLSRNFRFDYSTWEELLQITVVVQAIAISCAIALRLIAGPLQRMSTIGGGLFAFIVLVLISTGAVEGLIFLLYIGGYTIERWPDWHLSLLLRTGLFSSIIWMLALRYAVIYQRVQIESESKQADRLQALQSRIRPHFLFNSMNSIATLIRSDPETAEKALEDLADVFRTLLADARKMVPIAAESELTRQYLDIEKLRLGDRLQVRWSANNVPRSAQIPSLTLQPLIENAVYHGIEPSFAGGTINVQLWSESDMLNVLITNPVPELTNHTHRKGNRIAIDNVRERLTSHFGGQAKLQNTEKLGSYFVKLRIPIVRG